MVAALLRWWIHKLFFMLHGRDALAQGTSGTARVRLRVCCLGATYSFILVTSLVSGTHPTGLAEAARSQLLFAVSDRGST